MRRLFARFCEWRADRRALLIIRVRLWHLHNCPGRSEPCRCRRVVARLRGVR